MNPFRQIAEEVDRFHERTMRAPDFVIVGLREWIQMERLAATKDDLGTFFVHTVSGKIPIRRHPIYYSMIAPVLEWMP